MSAVTLGSQTFSLGALQTGVAAEVRQWERRSNIARLWRRDASLFSGADETRWLGWLEIVDRQLADVGHLKKAAEDAARGDSGRPFRHVVVLGMGGSSLCPEVMARTFGSTAGYPELLVLDSTAPAQVRALDARLDPATTLFVVASKSGGTIEPNSFKQYFYDRARQAVGPERAGRQFVAVTDPGTKMQSVAESDGFRAIYYGLPDIGGRFSALSNFGMVPAASSGIDAVRFLEHAAAMVRACANESSVEANPGVLLGLVVGTAATAGRDKLSLITSPGIGGLGAWLEQLVAESTGKLGKGIVPVDGERPAPPATYGDDRLFVYTRLAAAPDAGQDAAVDALRRAGLPVVTIDVPTTMHLGQEFYRWEIATAVAGAVLGINPFDQPDVESAKIVARQLMSTYEETGKLPDESPIAAGAGLSLYADAKYASALQSTAAQSSTTQPDVAALVKAHLAGIGRADYFAVNAYVEMIEPHDAEIQRLRHAVRDNKRVATTVGFGPRFLHSTGQLHKGGPNNGVFLQITSDDAADLPVPGQKYTFGILKAAQAQGDFAVLAERDRRILRVHLGTDVAAGLKTLRELIESAL
jgi:transaldolase / glucose-6-phosphate isomerase